MMKRMFGLRPAGAAGLRLRHLDRIIGDDRRRGGERGAAEQNVAAVECAVLQLVLRCRRWALVAPFSDDTSKTEMARGRIHRFRMARGRAVAAAVVRRAQMRAAFDDLAGDFDLRLARVVAVLLAAAARIFRNAARLRRVGLVLLRKPVGGPFPDIADHVVHAVAVGRKRRYGRRAIKTVLAAVLVREIALPGVGHVLAAGRELVAPGELGAVEAAARGEFPFGFGRQILAGPCGVGQRVGVSDVHDGMIILRVDVALRTVRAAPVRAFEKPPPLAPVFQIDRMTRRREHQRAGIEHVRQRAGIILRVGRDFGEGDVAGGFDEFLELPVGHRRAVDPKTVDADAMRRRLFRIMLIRSHAERAAGNEDHVRMGRLLRPLRSCNVVHAPARLECVSRSRLSRQALSENEAKRTAKTIGSDHGWVMTNA